MLSGGRHHLKLTLSKLVFNGLSMNIAHLTNLISLIDGTQGLPQRCERRGMGARGSISHTDDRSCAATRIPIARSLQWPALDRADRSTMALVAPRLATLVRRLPTVPALD